jgi:diaminopimelate decarboxylase
MDRLLLFPDTTKIENHTLNIGGFNLDDLANQFGTPLYIYDRSTLDNALDTYQSALGAMYPGESGVTYAGKAFLCLAIAEWSQQRGLWVDCTGLGEIAIAVAGGVPKERLLVHGVSKSAADLEAACDNAGVIVVDNPTEVESLIQLSNRRNLPELWLRYQPGLTVETHSFTQTGQVGSKFGMDAEQIFQAVQQLHDHALTLTGLHFHLGSQFHDLAPLARGIEHTMNLAERIGFSDHWTISPGGGWGLAYHEDELPHPALDEYIHHVTDPLVRLCRKRNLPLPRLQLEPGRSLVARAGVAVYRVNTIKQTANRQWVLLDGGLADNPRPALYGARYSALPVRDPLRQVNGLFWFAGPYCESGDVMIEALPFPDIKAGDLVAVPVSGAYQLSMSSNYNGSCRPAVAWLDQGQVQIIQERESVKDLFRRDHRLVKPGRTG